MRRQGREARREPRSRALPGRVDMVGRAGLLRVGVGRTIVPWVLGPHRRAVSSRSSPPTAPSSLGLACRRDCWLRLGSSAGARWLAHVSPINCWRRSCGPDRGRGRYRARHGLGHGAGARSHPRPPLATPERPVSPRVRQCRQFVDSDPPGASSEGHAFAARCAVRRARPC